MLHTCLLFRHVCCNVLCYRHVYCVICVTDHVCYRLCTVLQAVCCSDHIHCCPSGTICDVATSTCTKGAFSMPWQKKTPALKAGVNVQKVNIVCPGGESCPDDSTCCKMESGEYGCCPMPKVCLRNVPCFN